MCKDKCALFLCIINIHEYKCIWVDFYGYASNTIVYSKLVYWK